LCDADDYEIGGVSRVEVIDVKSVGGGKIDVALGLHAARAAAITAFDIPSVHQGVAASMLSRYFATSAWVAPAWMSSFCPAPGPNS